MPFMIIQKVLESIYHDYNDNSTTGHYREDRGDDGDFYTNSQVKANMLLAFVKNEPELKRQENDQYEEDRAMPIKSFSRLCKSYCNSIELFDRLL